MTEKLNITENYIPKTRCGKPKVTVTTEHAVYIKMIFFLPFLGPLPRHMEDPRLGVESEL